MMNFFLGTLGVWRITHLLNAEDGPWNIFVRFRIFLGTWGTVLDCFYCLSLWIAAPFAYWLGHGWQEKLLLWPALSAGAILAERLSAQPKHDTNAPVVYFEQPEETHVLRQESAANIKHCN